MRRASGDRLLLAVGARHTNTHPEWERWSRHATTITLDGLDLASAEQLMSARRPGLDAATAKRLREHTSGNPLYLTAVVAEYDAEELSRMHILPAPRRSLPVRSPGA